MKKFIVTNAVLNASQINGNESYDINITDNYVGDYIDAENKNEAIELAIDYLVEQIRQNTVYDVDFTNDTITVYDNNKKVEVYCNFSAKEKEK